MTFLVHLSDLHMTEDNVAQTLLFERLFDTLTLERDKARPERSTIVITGDVFDSGTDPPERLVAAFLKLHARMLEILGDAFTVVLPGNHDRRRFGLLGPNKSELFSALHRAADPARMHVLGQRTPFLAEVVPAALHRLPAHVVAYDSSYLPSGLIGAGGTFRLEDLLQVHAQLPDDGLPLLLLVHHHLIPTPVTDISHIDMVGTPRPIRWLVRSALPVLFSHADREELTMTALGAGTALSALHTFGRAVLLLHGHKHVPTARILRGPDHDSGDLILVSAGSAGRSEGVSSTQSNPARLWPSFNLVDLSAESLHVEALSFSPKRSGRPPVRRDLVRARRDGAKWTSLPCASGVSDAPLRVASDESDYALAPSYASSERWDLSCDRRVVLKAGAKLRRYKDFVHALPHLIPGTRAGRQAYRRVDLALDEPTSHRAHAALCRTIAEAARCYGPGTAFEWVGLLCRYGAEAATLRLSVPAGEHFRPFASVTDLTTGRERPAPIAFREGRWALTLKNCAPRTLLRIYWPLVP
ncbi:MAG TPA: metallophosphoesterase [Polyangiaceae bacterium]|jgi:3',5'-cyclic AMP phosphodiesterase CpdA|nr:metallophosphoesterase [Polyangiaceae bacterium]